MKIIHSKNRLMNNDNPSQISKKTSSESIGKENQTKNLLFRMGEVDIKEKVNVVNSDSFISEENIINNISNYKKNSKYNNLKNQDKYLDINKNNKHYNTEHISKIHSGKNKYLCFLNTNNSKKAKSLYNNKNNHDENQHPQNNPAHTFSENLLITDLDEFFRNVYDFYYNKGYKNILTQTVLDNLSYLFSIHFIILNLFIIDWKQIIMSCKYENRCMIELSKKFTVEEIKENLYSNKILFTLCYSFLMTYYFAFLIRSFILIKNMKFIKNIYDYKLKIKQSELENIKFDKILKRLIHLQKVEGFCRIKENITKYDIISRIMRQDNYMIALFSNNIIDTKIDLSFTFKIPLIFRTFEIFHLNLSLDFFSNYLYTKINEAVVNFAFGTLDKNLNKNFINLKWFRLKLFLFMLVECLFLLPLIFLKIIFFIFKNADNIKSEKKTLITNKIWDRKYQILFKNYNELQHYYEYRIYTSYKYLELFNNCFKSDEKIYNIIKKFLRLIFGSILILFFFISIFESRLLSELTIFGNNFVWIGLGVGIILSLTGDNPEKNYKENPYVQIYFDQYKNYEHVNFNLYEGKDYFDCDNRNYFYKKLLNCLINIPKDFQLEYDSYSKLMKKINQYYELSLLSIIKEILSMIFFPIILIKLIINAEKIRQFILQNSIEIYGLGTICTFSHFNFQSYKNNREKKVIFFEYGFNDKKFFNSCFYFRVSFTYIIFF